MEMGCIYTDSFYSFRSADFPENTWGESQKKKIFRGKKLTEKGRDNKYNRQRQTETQSTHTSR